MASGFGKPVGYQMLGANHLQSPTLLLKDFLREDISSCSSSGFKSFPRRQCCLQPHFCSSSSTKSALQKASESVLNAIKSLPFPARQRSPSFSRTQRCKAKKFGVLSRSLSQRLLSRSFWRRASSSKGDEATFATSTNSSASNSNINKWTESHFTCSLTAAKDFTEMEGSVTPTNFSTRDWSNEEKEQFSPVSVLDCPLFHEEEEITYPFNSTTTCSRVEGTKHKHMQKGQHFKGVASLKPVALEKRMSWLVMQEDEPIYKHPTKPCRVLVPIMCTQNGKSNVQVGADRDVCITETGKYRESSWRICDEEIQHLAMEQEVDFSTSLVEELVLDLTTSRVLAS